MADRPANRTAPSVSAPGKGAKRTDLQTSNRPVRIATGQPYGSAKQQEKMHQARPNKDQAPVASVGATAPSPAPAQPPASIGDPDAMMRLISRDMTQFPDDPMGGPSQTRRPAQVSAEDAAIALEQVIANSGSVSMEMLRLLNDLKREALASPDMSIDGSDIDALDSL